MNFAEFIKNWIGTYLKSFGTGRYEYGRENPLKSRDSNWSIQAPFEKVTHTNKTRANNPFSSIFENDFNNSTRTDKK